MRQWQDDSRLGQDVGGRESGATRICEGKRDLVTNGCRRKGEGIDTVKDIIFKQGWS